MSLQKLCWTIFKARVSGLHHVYAVVQERLERIVLAAYRVILEDGTSYITSMSEKTTLEDVKLYFVGQNIDRGVYPKEKMVKVIGVEKIN